MIKCIWPMDVCSGAVVFGVTFRNRIARCCRLMRRATGLASTMVVGGLLAVAAPSAVWAASSTGCTAVNGGAWNSTLGPTTDGKTTLPTETFEPGDVLSVSITATTGANTDAGFFVENNAGDRLLP